MAKIQLIIRKLRDYELEKCIPDIGKVIRIICHIRLKKRDGWGDIECGLIDSGGFISLIPFTIWQDTDVKILGNYTLRGVVPKKGCELPVKVGKVKGILLDNLGNLSDELEFRAYLAPTDKVPLIIGIKDLLENFKIWFDIKNETGFIEV